VIKNKNNCKNKYIIHDIARQIQASGWYLVQVNILDSFLLAGDGIKADFF